MRAAPTRGGGEAGAHRFVDHGQKLLLVLVDEGEHLWVALAQLLQHGLQQGGVLLHQAAQRLKLHVVSQLVQGVGTRSAAAFNLTSSGILQSHEKRGTEASAIWHVTLKERLSSAVGWVEGEGTGAQLQMKQAVCVWTRKVLGRNLHASKLAFSAQNNHRDIP